MPHATYLKVFVIGCLLLSSTAKAQDSGRWIPARVLGAVYPQVAKFSRISGTVEAKCNLRANGSVATVDIVSGHPVLAHYVKSNLLQWMFTLEGNTKTVKGEVHVIFIFRFDGDCDRHKECKEQFWFDFPERVTVISELPTVTPNLH